MSNHASEQARPPAPSLDLTGKRVVVGGGKKAIGLGVAQAAHAMGAAATVASRRNVSAEERPDLAAFDEVVLDIRDEAAVHAAFEAIGPFDHLVVTAGPEMGSWGSFMDPDMSGVRSYLEGKFLGTWACARHAAPHLLAGGSVTFLTSPARTPREIRLAIGRGQAAVNREDHAVDEAGVIAGQERDHGRHLVRRSRPAHRQAAAERRHGGLTLLQLRGRVRGGQAGGVA